ncbi:MAG TPA: hypothetical protein VFV58_05880 [Blastocatellia bacterium]|jgi:hypothetical protein|nr:hypothetical protein [Blastocatellia bacterium]
MMTWKGAVLVMSKFPRYLLATVGCCLLLRLTSGAAISPEDEIALKKGQQLIVKIPGKMLKYETRSISTGAPILTASVSASGETITVEGASDWQARGWPLMMTLYYEKSIKKKEYTEVECRSSQAYLKLRFSPDTPDVNAVLRQLIYLGSVDMFESSAEFKALEEKLLPVTFHGALGQIPRDKQLQLIKDLDYNDEGLGVEEFKGKQYIAFSKTDLTIEFNSRRMKQPARIATILKVRLLPALEKIAPFITDANGIYGIKIRARTFYKDFHSERNLQPHVEVLEIFAPYDLVEQFYNRDITDQKLVEGIFISVDGKRIEVDLSQAAQI